MESQTPTQHPSHFTCVVFTWVPYEVLLWPLLRHGPISVMGALAIFDEVTHREEGTMSSPLAYVCGTKRRGCERLEAAG